MADSQPARIAEEPWRVFKIMGEFVESFDTLSRLGPAVTIFGSARTKPEDIYYKAAQSIAEGLAREKIAIVTGGGPGIMEAANRGGAKPKTVPSVGAQHRAALRTEVQPLLEPHHRLPLFLHPQGQPGEVQHGLRLHARRIRHPR
jgi:predicted Rossmann-fold nucleotide-binding protein